MDTYQIQGTAVYKVILPDFTAKPAITMAGFLRYTAKPYFYENEPFGYTAGYGFWECAGTIGVYYLF